MGLKEKDSYHELLFVSFKELGFVAKVIILLYIVAGCINSHCADLSYKVLLSMGFP